MKTKINADVTNQRLALSSRQFISKSTNLKKNDGLSENDFSIMFLLNGWQKMLLSFTDWNIHHYSLVGWIREDDDDDEEDSDDYYSPTDWERESNESDEDYSERIQDLEDWLENFD